MDLSQAEWRKSTYSGDDGGMCVEVAALRGVVALRDSKMADGPVLAFDPAAWAAFVRRIRNGEGGRVGL